MHSVHARLRIDQHAAAGLAAGDLKKAAAQPLVEIAPLLLEACLVSRARRGPRYADIDGKIEDQRQVRSEVTGDDAVERLEIGAGNPAAIALIGDRRIGKA